MRLRLVLVALVAALFGLAPAATTVSAATFTDDVSNITRMDVHEFVAAGASPAQLSGSWDRAAKSAVEAPSPSTTLNSARNATNTAGDIVGLTDDYIDITAKGSGVRNVQSSVGRSSFEQNLMDAGCQPRVSTNGPNVVTYEFNGARYVVRDAAKSTGGPTADFYPAGSDVFTLKIRLAG